MVMPPKKEPVAEKLNDSRTAHLQPLIDFLKAQGNPPGQAPGYGSVGADGFYFDRDGFGTFYFEQPLDIAALAAHFALPASILLGKTAVSDSRNFVSISHLVPQGPPIQLDF